MSNTISDYYTAKDIAKTWQLSHRRVSELCFDGRVDGAIMIGKMWLIPKNTQKPIDARTVESQFDGVLVKPFVKWAGGKNQLLKEISSSYPNELGKSINKYAEPFIGGGAVLFDVLSKYDIKEAYISDINKELIKTYVIIKGNCDDLIELLTELQTEYISRNDEDRKDFFNHKRKRFNELKILDDDNDNAELASLFIFLNKTCFNGLYRVNRRGEFNVPSGRYKNPTICNENNLRKISKKLQRVNIVYGDYRESISFIDQHTFVYFDPPYRPITSTASFTAYTELLFDDENQKELAEFVGILSEKHAKILISNSDPKNSDCNDDFFDHMYEQYDIIRIDANRSINSKGDGRGKISELLIKNYIE